METIMKVKKLNPGKPELHVQIHELPLEIRGGKLIEPEAEVIEFLAYLFAKVEASDHVPLQASLEVKFLTVRRK